METNDPQKPKLTIYMSLVISTVFTVAPQENLVVNTKVGTPAQVTVELTNQFSEPVDITGINNPFGDHANVIIETIEAGQKYSVTLTTKAIDKFRWSGRVNLNLKGAPVPVFSLPAFLEIKE